MRTFLLAVILLTLVPVFAADGQNAPGQGVSRGLVFEASNRWKDTGVNVEKGQKFWFTISSLEMYSCTEGGPRVNADGEDPFTPDPKRRLPEVKHCALIAKIGKEGDAFPVGLTSKPFTADHRGRLYIEVNDNTFRDNTGRLQVYIKTGDTQ